MMLHDPTASDGRRGISDLSVTTPAPRDQWTVLVDRDPDALVSQTPTWIDCMCAFGFQDASRLYESRSGARFVLPMVRRAAPLVPYLDIYASMPMAWGMGGLLCERPPSADEMRSIVADLRATAALRTSIRPNPLHAERWAAAMDAHVTAIPRRAHVLELTGGTARLWSELPKRTRQGVHKAERGGVEIECDTAGRFVGAYFDLYALSIERWAQQQHEPLWLARWRASHHDTQAKFERLASALGDAMRVWIARSDGVPVAGAIVLIGANASDTRGAMNKELAAPVRANDLLQWCAIEDACQAGCRSYHLGESGDSRSLAHFKERFGARPVRYAEYHLERLPVTAADAVVRRAVKRALGFRDT